MHRAFKYRIYPKSQQQELIDKHIGSCRFVYNLALETKNTAYQGRRQNLTRYDLQQQLVGLKEECQWLKEVNAQSLQCELLYMDNAYKAFFKGSNFPKFKSKNKCNQSYTVPQFVKIANGKLSLPKFREGIKINIHRPLQGKIKSATVSKTKTGKYFVSLLCEVDIFIPDKPVINSNQTIGIDLGIKDFLVTSKGEVIENPKYLRSSIERLKVLQRRVSKKKKGSSNKRKANLKVAKLHEKITNQRNDFLHKASTKLIRENQTICLETLAVKNMVKNHNLAQAISDASWSTFVSMLEYKADWYGKNILRIGQFAPSSKTCSNCGSINKELTLKDREWACNNCCTVLDRDINAAVNIKSFTLNNLQGRDCP